MATIRYVPSRSAHARVPRTHSMTLDNRRILVAPTGPKCGNKKRWLRRLRIGQKCGSARTFPSNDGDAGTDEINAGNERRICYRSQEFRCLLGGLLEVWLCLSPPPFLLRCRMAECLQCAHPNFFCTHTYILTHRFTIPLKYLNANYL